MPVKKNPNHAEYIRALRRLGPEGRLRRAFELTEFSRALFLQGLRIRFPEKSDAEIREIYIERLKLCHNRKY
jgi:hypothetical protein